MIEPSWQFVHYGKTVTLRWDYDTEDLMDTALANLPESDQLIESQELIEALGSPTRITAPNLDIYRAQRGIR